MAQFRPLPPWRQPGKAPVGKRAICCLSGVNRLIPAPRDVFCGPAGGAAAVDDLCQLPPWRGVRAARVERAMSRDARRDAVERLSAPWVARGRSSRCQDLPLGQAVQCDVLKDGDGCAMEKANTDAITFGGQAEPLHRPKVLPTRPAVLLQAVSPCCARLPQIRTSVSANVRAAISVSRGFASRSRQPR